MLLRLSYKHPCPNGHNEYRVVDAEPNGSMPPPGRGNGSDPELLDRPNWSVPLPLPGGSAESYLDTSFSYKKMVESMVNGIWIVFYEQNDVLI